MPLMCKVGLTGTEPLGLKSGILARLYKGKGSKTACSSFRAIMLLPTIAKILHKAFRPSLYHVFASNALPAQLGGRRRTSVVLGSHLTRAFGRWCHIMGQSAITLFADVASAYYCAVRGLTAQRHLPGIDSGATEAAEAIAYPEEVQTQLDLPTALARADASPWLETITAELNSSTWMVLAGDDRPVLTRQGSRPGSSWADLFYGVTVPRIIAHRDSLRASYLGCSQTWRVRWDGRRDLSVPSEDPKDWICETTLDDVIWADDLAKCIPVPDAAAVGATLTREAGLLTEAFSAHGYSLSFGPAKTAAVVAVRGPGSRQVRRQLFQGAATLPILREDGGAAMLPLVPTYRHLGVQTAASCSISPELKHRISQAWSAFRQGRTRVFRSRRIPLVKRGALLATHVLTKLLFATGAWPALGRGDHALFSHAVLSLYRQTLVIGPDGDQHITHATVCSLLQQPPPAVLLLVEQTRYIVQLTQSAPTQLWALLRRDPAYIAHLRAAVAWLYGWICNTTDLPDPSSAWDRWQTLIEQRPGLFRAYVKRARGLELARTSGFAALQALRRVIVLLCQGPPMPAPRGGQAYSDGCLPCRIAFPTRTSWACHASRVHGYRTTATLLAAGVSRPTCHACGKLYASKGRLQRHLQSSAACRVSWGGFVPVEGGAPRGEVHPQAPPHQQSGCNVGPQFLHDPAHVHLGLLSELQAADVHASEGLWDLVCGYIAPLSILRHTVATWGNHPGPDQDAEEVFAQAEDLQLLLDVDLWCDDFRAPRAPKTPLDCCPPLLPVSEGDFCFVLTGTPQIFDVDDPPSRDFCYPFRGSVPLAVARRAVAWLEAACDTVGLAVQASQMSPVIIRASRAALAMLEPAVSWLVRGGFVLVEPGLRTPTG